MIWPVSLSTGLFLQRQLVEVLDDIRSAGFVRIQVAAFQEHFNYHDPDAVERARTELSRLGVAATSAHAPFSLDIDITLLDEHKRAWAVGETAAAATALSRLGGKVLVVHGGSADEAAVSQARDRLSQSVRSIGEIYQHCRYLGLTLAVEDMLAHLVGGGTEQMMWLLQHIPPDVGVCLDTGHSFLARDLFGRAQRFGPRLVMAHVHDNCGVHDDHLPPGQGEIAWPPLLDELHRAGFRGELVMEVNSLPDVREALKRAWQAGKFLEGLSQGKPYTVKV